MRGGDALSKIGDQSLAHRIVGGEWDRRSGDALSKIGDQMEG